MLWKNICSLCEIWVCMRHFYRLKFIFIYIKHKLLLFSKYSVCWTFYSILKVWRFEVSAQSVQKSFLKRASFWLEELSVGELFQGIKRQCEVAVVQWLNYLSWLDSMQVTRVNQLTLCGVTSLLLWKCSFQYSGLKIEDCVCKEKENIEFSMDKMQQ